MNKAGETQPEKAEGRSLNLSYFQAASTALIASCLFIGSACQCSSDSAQDAGMDGSNDTDTSADGDAGTDTDGDSDADTETDTETDSDTDTDADTDTDSDADTDGDSDGDSDTDTGTGSNTDPDAGIDSGPSEPILYPFGNRHSPITESVARRLRATAAIDPSLHGDVFAKMGDSNMLSANFAACFSGPNIDLDGRTDLQAALDRFNSGDAAGVTPFERVSSATQAGLRAGTIMNGSPSPLDQELAAISPRIATVMLGTNDVGIADIFDYTRNMFAIADALSAQGVVPILFTIPPRDDSASADAEAVDFNTAIHGVAQARQIPLVDLDNELRDLAGHGLSVDGFNLDVYLDGGARGCVLTAAGLAHGHNVQNLLALEALTRAVCAIDAETAPDATAAVRPGQGTLVSPFEIDALPFVDLRDTTVDGESRLDSYPACDASAIDESGNEILYRATIPTETLVRIRVVSLGGADLDVHILSDAASADSCTVSDDREIDVTLQPGTSWISVDTIVGDGGSNAGEYLLLVLPE